MKKLWRLFQRSKLEEELQEEFAFHLEEESDEQQAVGLSAKDARDAARRSLGNVTRLKEETRAAWGWEFLETALQDVRIAARTFRKKPGFSVVAILILGLGVGASTAVFSVVNGVILKPLAFRDPNRIVALSTHWKKTDAHGQVSVPDFDDWRSQSTSFDSMAFYSSYENAVTIESGAQFATVAQTSPEFFRVLGVEPAVGRPFQADEIAPGSTGAAIVSNSFWQTRLGGDRSALGKSIRLAGLTLPIVGIMPAGFRFPDKTEIWIPADTVFRIIAPNRGAHNYRAVGRLKAGVSVESARAEMTLIGNRLEQLYAGSNQGTNVAVAPLGDEMVRGLTTMLYLLLGSVCVLLLISCGNVANMLMAKAAERTREMGVRAALGAARGRIVRQLVTESLVLGIASLLVGLLVARFGTSALVALAPGNIPRLDEIGMNPAVLGFAAGLTLVACLLFGLAPAFGASRVDVNQALKQSSRGTLHGGSALRSGVVIGEVALSVVLLTGAGLLIRSLAELSNVSLGFETHQVLVMETNNPTSNVEEAKRVVRAYRTLLDQAAGIPGIVAVGAARIPPGQVASDGSYEIDQAAVAGTLTTQSPQAVYSIVSPGAFSVLGIPIRQGRDFSAADSPDAPLTAIVNETVAKQAFPGQDPIGHAILTGMDILKPMRIVGVVADIHQRGPGKEALAEIYMPYEQHPRPSTSLRILARTSVAPASVIDALRQQAKQIAPDMPVKFSTMEARMWDNVAVPRFRTVLLATFAAIAVVLAMAGVYGVVSLLVNQRSQEIGLRMALGASTGQVMNMVLSQGVRLGAIGLALGVVAAAATARFLNSMLFEVKSLDPLTYASVAALVAMVAVGACFLPARRASRIDPMVALREE
jgi:putative ABC transport system permease protein